jgi:chromosome partitioning protein
MIISVTNLKGGVGKTIVSQNIAVCLAIQDYSVCLIDTDTNQNSVSWAGMRDEDLSPIVTVGITDPKALTKEAKKLNEKFDFIVIDGTPSLSQMTTRIILLADVLIIPILAAANDLRAMPQFMDRLDEAKGFRDEIPAYFFLNQFQSYAHQNTVAEVLYDFEIPFLKTKFRNRVAFGEASAMGSGAAEWTDSKAKSEANMLAHEILSKIKELKLVPNG